MNLNTIAITPYVSGVIKVDSLTDADGSRHTLERMAVLARPHDVEATTQAQRPMLARHPIEARLLDKVEANKRAGKIVEIPVRMFFNKTKNAIGIRYQAFDVDGVPVCSGDGKSARRLTQAGDGTQTLQEVACPGCDACPYANNGEVSCARQVRVIVQIAGQDESFSTFEVRSSSLNTYRTLAAQLALVERRFGGLRHVPLRIRLWQASNNLSGYESFYLMRLEIDAATETEAMQVAKQAREALTAAGINDDIDAVYAHEGEANPTAWDDFSMISDFYEITRQPGRRQRQPIFMTGNTKEDTDGNTATSAEGAALSLIQRAVRSAGAAETTAESASTA